LEYNEAITAYDTASEIDPQNSAVWYNKAVTLSKLGDSDEAIKVYAKAIEINPLE
jgi:tetratricopeptide (TPR) repeat protein